ncbi:MAG: TMEM165/GDT1 family protein [Nocardiopsaceae bacterium]|nr:TMEM165/GDT1 family protein [Nocardiopsaceae bacterium]
MNALPLILTVFVACAVEAVEALTIVLASGLTREWRSTFQGTGAALVALAVITAAIGPAISFLPLTALRLVVGALLAIFGLQWLRKAVLRATGFKSLHDEASAYLREVTAAKEAAVTSRRGVGDWYAFTLSFKGVLLEGLEVVFIVITFGDNQGNIGAAVIGAAAAVVVVAAAGVAVKAPLTRVPENWMKFAVGVMLTSFGTFWGAEGAGVAWPGDDAALLVLVPVVALVAAAYIVWLRRRQAVVSAASARSGASEVVSS